MWEYGPGPRAAGAIWSPRAVAGSGQEIGGADVGLRMCGLRSPSVWLTSGTFRPCSRSLIPGPVRLGDLVASGIRGSRAEVCVELQVAYAGASCHALFGRLAGWVSEPSSRDASSKATPVYHPRG
jgi:hypothetical protein